MASLCPIVDIGGDKYFMGEGKPIEYAIKSREEFNIAYADPSLGKNKTHPDIPKLMCKYFPFSGIGDAKRPEIQPGDLDLINKTLKNRIKNLEESIKITNSSLYTQRNRKILDNLKKIVSDIDCESRIPGRAFNTVQKTTTLKTLEEVYKKPENIFDSLIQFAWYMMHPSDVPDNIQKNWLELLKSLQTVSVSSLINLIKNQTSEEDKIEPLNYFSRLDLSDVIKESTMDLAFEKAKNQIIDDVRAKQKNRLVERLKAIATILQSHGYLSLDEVGKISNTKNNSVEKFIKDVDLNLINKIGYSFDPIFAYFKKIYDPAYSFVDNTVKNFMDRGMKVPIDDLIKLINYSNILLTDPRLPFQEKISKYGIMRIDNVKPEVMSFLRSMNVEIEKEITKKADVSKEKSELYRQLLSLPIVTEAVISTTAPKKMEATGIAGIFLSEQIYLAERLTNFYNIFEKNPMGDDLIKKGKLTPDFYPAAFAAMNDFFKKDSVFVIYGNYQNYPNNVPYNLWTIDITDTSLIKKPVEDAITKFNKENTANLTLSNIVKETGLYVNTPLLAMFSLIGFNKQLPTPKPVVAEPRSIVEEEAEQSKLASEKKTAQSLLEKAKQEELEKISKDTALTDKDKLVKGGELDAKYKGLNQQLFAISDMKGLTDFIKTIRTSKIQLIGAQAALQQLAKDKVAILPEGVRTALEMSKSVAAPTTG